MSENREDNVKCKLSMEYNDCEDLYKQYEGLLMQAFFVGKSNRLCLKSNRIGYKKVTGKSNRGYYIKKT